MQMALHSAKCDPQQPLSCKHGLYGQAEVTTYNFLKPFFPKYNLLWLKSSLLSNAGNLAHLYSLDLTFCLGSSLSNQQASMLCLSYQDSGYDFHLEHWLLLGFYMHFNLFLGKQNNGLVGWGHRLHLFYNVRQRVHERSCIK